MAQKPVRERGPRRWDVIGLIVAWGTWAALTLVLILSVRHYSRNVPYFDDFAMIPVMTGAQPVTLEWAWAQHNEHRPFISRLIMAGLFRGIALDFRVVRYANVALLSISAAAMLALARRLRGSARVTDAALPLSLLGIAQLESLMIGFAMNLILTTMATVALIASAGFARPGRGTIAMLGIGVAMVVLPLCGGSGLVMLPPLGIWLVGYVVFGWWSGERPSWVARAVGTTLGLASLAVGLLYLHGYTRPVHHPLPTSAGSVASSIVMYLSLSIYPRVVRYWWPAGPIAVGLVLTTLAMLARVGYRRPEERPRALALMAVILAMLCVAAAVGYSRASFGRAGILASRYVTLSSPLLCVIYVAWLLYARGRVRRGVHLTAVLLLVLAIPAGIRFAHQYGSRVRASELLVERCLLRRVPTSVLMEKASWRIFPDPRIAAESYEMLRAARVGAFEDYDAHRVVAAPNASPSVRR